MSQLSHISVGDSNTLPRIYDGKVKKQRENHANGYFQYSSNNFLCALFSCTFAVHGRAHIFQVPQLQRIIMTTLWRYSVFALLTLPPRSFSSLFLYFFWLVVLVQCCLYVCMLCILLPLLMMLVMLPPILLLNWKCCQWCVCVCGKCKTSSHIQKKEQFLLNICCFRIESLRNG